MDALILSCGTGGGHNSACAAIEQELSARGHNVRTLNPYLLKSEKTADMVNNAYNILVQRAPSAFGMVYRLGNAYRNLPVSSPVYRLNGQMAPSLERYICKNRFDAVIMTHLFPAEMITNMKRHGIAVPPTYFITTDYTCAPFIEETDCDYYIIPAEELTEEFIMRGVPRERIVPLGIPVQRQFREKIGRSEARKRLGLDNDKKYILIAGGSIGAGQIEQIVPMLLEHYGENARLIVICGNNQALYKNMEKLYHGRCDIMQYTSEMADYMRACDLFLSKPGGLSSTEAAAVGTALIHITPIPGCETRNMEFFEKNGMCVAVNSPKKQLLDACDRLMSEGAREKMAEKQRSMISADSASEICGFVEKEHRLMKTAG